MWFMSYTVRKGNSAEVLVGHRVTSTFPLHKVREWEDKSKAENAVLGLDTWDQVVLTFYHALTPDEIALLTSAGGQQPRREISVTGGPPDDGP